MEENIVLDKKMCKACGTVKYLIDFYKCKRSKTYGVTSNCKKCVNLWNTSYEKRKKEKLNNKDDIKKDEINNV